MSNHPNHGRYTEKSGAQFLAICPRGFANETTIYRVTADKIAEAEEAFENYEDDVERGGYTNWLTSAPDCHNVVAWRECQKSSDWQ